MRRQNWLLTLYNSFKVLLIGEVKVILLILRLVLVHLTWLRKFWLLPIVEVLVQNVIICLLSAHGV